MNSEPNLAKWLRYLVYASAFIPLVIFQQYLSPFHFGKVILLRMLVEFMVVLYLLLVLRNRAYLPKSHPITWAFLAFTLAFTLATFTSVSFLQSFWGSLERMGGLFTFWHFFAFYLVTVSVLRTKEHWRTMLDLTVAVGLVSAIYGFLQKSDWSFILGSGNRARPFGTIGNAALFAGYQLVVAYLAATLLFTKHMGPNSPSGGGLIERSGKILISGLGLTLLVALLTGQQGLWVIPVGLVFYGVYLFAAAIGKARWFYGISAGLMLLAILTTAVRGSLLAIVVSGVLAALLWSVLYRSKRAKVALLGSLAAVALFFVLAIMLRSTPLVQNSGYLRRITDFSSSTYTVQTRFWAWSAGLQGWSESPRYIAVGWGPENFNIPFSEHFNPKFYAGPGSETYFDRAHNMFVEVLVTMGLVGILTYLSIFVALVWTLAKFMRHDDDRRILGIGLTSLTVAYAIHNAFIFDTSANFLLFFTVLAFVVHISQKAGEQESERVVGEVPLRTRWTMTHRATAAVLSVAALVLAYSTGVKPTKANYAVTRAIIAGWKRDFPGAVNQYRIAIDYNTAGRNEFRQRYTQYVLETGAMTDTSKIPNFKDVVQSAIKDMEVSVSESPRDYLPLLYLSRLHILLGKDNPKDQANDKALEYSMKALEISPTFVRTYYEIAQAYLNKKEFDKAYEWFSKAFELNPNVPTTQWYMGLVLLQKGQATGDKAVITKGLSDAVTALKNGYALGEADAQKLAGAYIAVGDYKNVAELYKQLIGAFPTNGAYWEQLIAVYLKVGDKESAIATIRKAMAQPGVGTEPAFKKKADATLKELGVKP